MLAAFVVLLRSLGLICRGHRAVALENVALRQQLAVFRRTVRRPQLRTRDRLFWVLLAKAWPKWRTALIVVQPDTVVRWHRQWLRRRWTQRSIHARPGRPSTAAAIRALVDKMGAANPLWGAPRIHGELVKLGIAVSERTVSRLLRRHRRPPSQTWRTFLTNHVTSLVSMDFFTVPTLTGRVLFVLVLLSHHRRQIVHLAVTNIQQPHGRRNRSLTPFRTTPRRGGSSEIAMPSMATSFGAVSRASASPKPLLHRRALGRIRSQSD
jgi:putative transposase